MTLDLKRHPIATVAPKKAGCVCHLLIQSWIPPIPAYQHCSPPKGRFDRRVKLAALGHRHARGSGSGLPQCKEERSAYLIPNFIKHYSKTEYTYFALYYDHKPIFLNHIKDVIDIQVGGATLPLLLGRSVD